MALTDHVVIVITATSTGIPRAGFGVPMILSVNAAFGERIRYYTDISEVAVDFSTTTSPEYLAAQALFAQDPHPARIAIGRAVGVPTQRYRIDVSSVAAGYVYGATVRGEGVTSTELEYVALADITFTAANAGDVMTSAAHGMETGVGPFRVSNAGGALPTNLAADTDYWIIKLTADTFQLAATRADAIAETEVVIGSDGTGTQTLRRAQNDVICAQLVQGLNDVVGKNYTATQTAGSGETDYVVVTATTAGDWCSVEVSDVSLLKVAQDHAEPGTTLATDLNAISLANADWYCLITLYNSDAYTKAAAAWIETKKRIYLADLSMSETVTLAAGGGDTADDLKGLNYKRTATVYHPSPAAMLGSSWAGTCLHLEPGEETWKFKSPAGVSAPAMTPTHRANLVAKHVNFLEIVATEAIMSEGTVCSGSFIDITRSDDWVDDDMSKGVFGAMRFAKKIPFTDPGIQLIVNEVEASLDRAVQRGIYAADPKPVVTAPKAKDVAASDKANRTLPDIRWSATRAGAVHKVAPISGVVSV